MCTRVGRVFQRICVKESIFANFRRYVPVFLMFPTFWTSEIVSFYIKDFNGYFFLAVVLQRVYFFRILVLERVWILARNVY